MAASYRKPRIKDVAFRRLLSVILIALSGVLLLVFLLRTNSIADLSFTYSDETDVSFGSTRRSTKVINKNLKLPKHTEFSISLEKRNQMPPRNFDLYPTLAKDHIVIVLYVHNRPQYLQAVVNSLSQVAGISETLLIVSHDGYFDEMNKIVDGIKFCRVKQIFAPFSPHVFPDSFPGTSPTDCRDKQNSIKDHCEGNPDQYGNHRSPKIVSLKHHWWWMMNTCMGWLLTKLKPEKCPSCYAANLAPSDVKSRGEGWDSLIAERMGNVGYSFNRTVWRKIHRKAREFCSFDDYNWDITMWAEVYPSFGGPVYTLRGPRTSAVHFGKCGLHQGQGEKSSCIDNGAVNIEVEDIDRVPNFQSNWGVHVYKHQEGYKAGFRGWGGWGDVRDHQLCLEFAKMYGVWDAGEK
ncbi:beta-1 [Abeliophyllum distichum]|uniref:Alpha-1,6-mannosyl-glycoprotein 2-beta-N-acetylglucosaminyltransferase n=1 Tax=Abeliophyllum distichum TaxID=126358 RepID=A0ABD1QE25_9LAMI